MPIDDSGHGKQQAFLFNKKKHFTKAETFDGFHLLVICGDKVRSTDQTARSLTDNMITSVQT
ncbi:hypothetical protein [Lacticaseibacillus paracasei]|uniref:hypothetical protein n=1 Tax=Lacticaseibacillus paracasei TaxID=1597 RepID=UPI0031DA5116